MTVDEELMARGRLVTDFSDTRRRMGTLISEATRIGELYTKLGKRLRDIGSVHCYDREEKESRLDSETESVLNAEKVRALFRDLHETRSRFLMLERQMKDCGLDS